MLSGHWGTIFDHTSPFGTIRSLRYNIWSYLSIWYYQVTEVQYLILTLHLVLSGHWGTIFDNTSPFVAIRSLRYNIWSYPSIWYYQVTEVQYLIIPLHLIIPGHWGTIFDPNSPSPFDPTLHLVLSGHWGTIFDHNSPFGAIRSLRYNIWSYPSPGLRYNICTIRSLRYNIWSYLSIWYYQVTEVQYLILTLHLVLSGHHWGTIFDNTSPFVAIRSLRYNISPFGTIRSLRYNIWSYLSICCYQVTEVQYLIIPLHLVLSGHWGTIFDHTSPFVLSGHWGTIFDHTSPFGTIRSLRYNIWQYLSICCYQVTEVQYLIIPLHLVLSSEVQYLSLLSGHWIFDHTSPTIFDHTSPFGTIRSLRYNIWS